MAKYSDQELLEYFSYEEDKEALKLFSDFRDKFDNKKYNNGDDYLNAYDFDLKTIGVYYTSYATNPQQVIDFGNFLLNLKNDGHKIIYQEYDTFMVTYKVPKDFASQMRKILTDGLDKYNQRLESANQKSKESRDDFVITQALKILKSRGANVTIEGEKL